MSRYATALAALTWIAAWSAACVSPAGTLGEPDPVDASGNGYRDGATPHNRPDGAPIITSERCNELDDNRDGQVDEGCACEAGATQACWPGDSTRRHVGACADGTQTCAGDGEFAGWGPCQGAVLPSTEIPGNDLDEDCSGDDDCVPEAGGEVCSGGRDEDCDGLIDCDDPDCTYSDTCCAENNEVCNDGIDNDCDDLVDCDDADDCWASGLCTCTKRCPPGTTRWCDEPTYCTWGKQLCNPDGTWGACVEVLDKPLGCTDPYYDTWCCVAALQCCQLFPTDESIGTCPPGELVCEEI